MARLLPSEHADRNAPGVHVSPASKTFTKTAATPWNGSVTPASAARSPAAPNKAAGPPSHLPGTKPPLSRGSACRLTLCSCAVRPTEGSHALLQQAVRNHFFFFFPSSPVVWDYSLRKTYSGNEHRLLAFPLPGNRSAIWELDALWNTNPIISIRLPAVDHQSVCGLLLVALTHCGAQQRVFKKGGTQSAFSSSLLFAGLAHTLALERVVPAGGSVLWAPCCGNTWSSCFLF